MKRSHRTLVALLATSIAAAPLLAWNPEAETNARESIAEFKKKDPSMQAFFDQAAGYAVFPTVGKAGIGIGGARGKGLLFEGHQPSGRVTLTQVTVGLQWGGQAYSEIIFFEDAETLTHFKRGNFEFAAQASAIAATLGASADANYEHGVAVFTLAKGGLMYEASIGGQKFNYHP
jgi:lipid-binding SYLF domain-containing protein